MTTVMTAEEYANFTGRPTEEIEAMIAEAESDSITKESMDLTTLVFHNWSPETEARCREILGLARKQHS